MEKSEKDKRICRLLKNVVDHFEKEDNAVRSRQLRSYRRLKLYWNNLSNIWWSESDNQYKVYDGGDNLDQAYYDRPVNVFKAFLETIIAALSIQVPGVSCVPDDADNPLDISTAKSGDMIAALIYKHNNVVFLWLQALYVYCTEGLIAFHSYTDKDKEYGTYKKKKFKDEEVESYVCPSCGTELDDDIFIGASLQVDDEDDEGIECPNCHEAISPDLQKTKLTVERFVGEVDEAKTRVIIEVYGGLYVKVSNSAKKQKDTPYLIFSYETHYSNPLQMYPDLRKCMPQGGWSNVGINDPEEQYARVNTEYGGDYPENNVTVKNCWLRPTAFNVLSQEDCKFLKKELPLGGKLVLVNDFEAEWKNESLDAHWTLTRNPTSDYLTHEPLGELLTSIQDIVNDLISLTLQTIEHGISQTWVDPAVVNIPAQGQIEAAPGTLTAVKPVAANKNIGDAFYQSKTATLSPEIISFYRIVQELGQFVSGALPALFGGAQTKGSETASQYAMSKSSAMQRLQTPWKMLNIAWKELFSKAIPLYMSNIVQDEKTVKKDNQGNFINVFIRKSELDGKIGDYELESSEQLPLTEDQQRDIIMQIMTLNNTEIMTALTSPENIPFIKKVIRIPQFKLPGEDDRQKQYEEISILIAEQPVTLPPDVPPELIQAAQAGDQAAAMTIQQVPPQEVPSVEIDPDVDNHEIEADICRGWLISEAGRLAKRENPDGYKNVLLHMKMHIQIIQQRAMQAQMQQMTADNSGKVPEKKPARPETIEKESDARTPIS